MRFCIIFLDPEAQKLSRLTRSATYLEAPFPDCLDCRQNKAHAPRWMTALSFLLCFAAVICLFLSAMDSLPPSPLALIIIMVLASLAGWRLHYFITQVIEALAKQHRHMELDAPKEAPERMARVICLLTEDAQHGLLGEQGTISVIMRNIDRLLNLAQQHQYELRIRLEGHSCPDLTDTLTTIIHLRDQRLQLKEYCQRLQAYLDGCGKVASQLYAYHLLDRTERPEVALFQGLAMAEISGWLFESLRQVMGSVLHATHRINPSQAINDCFERTVPDFTAADKAIQAYLDTLPGIPNPPPPLTPAQ
jgi:hypothetical protein